MSGNRHRGKIFVNERDRTVFHFAERITLRVDISYLFDFERAFHGDGIIIFSPEIQEIGITGIFFSDSFDVLGILENFFHQFRHLCELFCNSFSHHK